MSNKIETKTNIILDIIPKKNKVNALKRLQQEKWFHTSLTKIEEYFIKNSITKNDIKSLLDVINLIYIKKDYELNQLDFVNNKIKETKIKINYEKRNEEFLCKSKTLACVLKERNNFYKIFINQAVESESYNFADMHEKGHILFNHLSGERMYLRQFTNLINEIYDTELKKYFEKSVLKNSKEKVIKLLFNEFANIATDMEINSKLFNNGEWIYAKTALVRSVILMHYNDLCDSIKDKNKENIIIKKFLFIVRDLVKRIDGEEGDFQFCYPGNKNWPEQLDWMTYMYLLVKDINNTMKQVMKNIYQQLQIKGKKKKDDEGVGQSPEDLGQENGEENSDMEDGSEGDGNNGEGKGEDKESKKKPGNEKKISQETLEEYAELFDDKIEAEKNANKNGELGEDYSEKFFNKERSNGSSGKGTGSSAGKVIIESGASFDQFQKFLIQHCVSKKNRKLKNDILYYSNRKKFPGNVIIPRRSYIEKWVPEHAYFLIDVSGSVPTAYVERIINTIVDNTAGIDLKKSRILFCDTQVVLDEIMSKRTKQVWRGGGTEIANGINYINRKGYMKKSTDKLFIISDLEDDLNNWIISAKKLPGIKYVVGYNISQNTFGYYESPIKRLKNKDFARKWGSVFKTFFITEKIGVDYEF